MAAGVHEINTYFGRCRCCLKYGYLKNMWEEHYFEGMKEIYVEMLVQCFALSWEPSEDSMEHDQICQSCVLRLRDAHAFKKEVMDSQEMLLAEQADESETMIKQEVDFTMDSDDVGSEFQNDPDDPDESKYQDSDDTKYDKNSDTKHEVMSDNQDTEYEDVEYLEDDISEHAADDTKATDRRTKSTATIPPGRKWPQKLPKSERYKTYKQYTEEDLRKALQAVKKEKLTLQEASKKFNIPAKTLCAKAKVDVADDQKGNTTDNTKPEHIKKKKGKPTIFLANIPPKVIKKIKKKEIKSENDKKINTPTQDVNDLLQKIKMEDDTTPTNAEEVRTKYKAIVNEKFKKEYDEPEKSDANELNKHKYNIKVILENSNATMIKGYRGQGYTCCFCNIQKEIPLQLKQHNLEDHSNMAADAVKVKYISDLVIRLDVTNLICRICNIDIDGLDCLIDHLGSHNKYLHSDVKNYIIPFKFDTDVLKCIKCSKEFKYFKLLSEHMSEHYKNFECSVCGRFFINKQSMQTHSYRHRNGVFKCAHCPKVFDTRPKKSVHERVTHTLLNKTRKCAYCEERFSTKDLVQTHESKVHGAQIPIFNCQACNKSYNSQSSLMTHRKRFHLMLRPHKCSYCEMAFFSRIELRSHTVTHTKSREFKCNVCNKMFGTKCSLNQHVRGHLDDRRFKCDNCERAFVHRTAFKVHMRSKHGQIV